MNSLLTFFLDKKETKKSRQTPSLRGFCQANAHEDSDTLKNLYDIQVIVQDFTSCYATQPVALFFRLIAFIIRYFYYREKKALENLFSIVRHT